MSSPPDDATASEVTTDPGPGDTAVDDGSVSSADTSSDGSSTDTTSTDDTSTGESSTDDTTSTDDSSTEDTSTDESSTDGSSAGTTSTGTTSSDDTSSSTDSTPTSSSSSVAADPRTSQLIVDVYSGDLGGKPNWQGAAEAANVVGAIIKATEGTAFDTQWFNQNWPRVKEVAAERYGQTWFRGAYHFLKFNCDGTAQANFYLDAIDAAGGFDVGDIIPIVDVELGNDGKPDEHGRVRPRNSNWDASAQQIIDCTTAWAKRVKERSGQEVMLYGNGAMRDKSISDRMGCDWLWIPRYTATLPRNMYERAGWSLDRVAMWQYCGDGAAALAGYPQQIENFGKVDISVLLFDTLADFHNKVCSQVIGIDH
jgi:GH25 family lysozyme M1 (1,4-beta-N-acetylmuramidase)